MSRRPPSERLRVSIPEATAMLCESRQVVLKRALQPVVPR